MRLSIGIPFPVEIALRRRDRACARIVDESIRFQQMKSTRYAATYLKFKGIRMEVALRVLSQPLRRRQFS